MVFASITLPAPVHCLATANGYACKIGSPRQIASNVAWNGSTRGMVAFAFAEGDDSISLEKIRVLSESVGVQFAAVLQPQGFGKVRRELVFFTFPDPGKKLAKAVFHDDDLIRKLFYLGLDFYNPAFGQSKTATSWDGAYDPPSGVRNSHRTLVALRRIAKTSKFLAIAKDQVVRSVVCEERAIQSGTAKGVAVDVFMACTKRNGEIRSAKNYRFQVLPNGPVHFAGEIEELPEDYKSPDEKP